MESELNELRAQALPRGLATATTSIDARATNATIVDTEGREYIDFAGGIGVMNVGHSHPKILAMQQRFPVIGDVRGLGAMVALELVEDRDTKKPATELTKAYRARLFANGLANLHAGTYDNVIRTLMPLTIEWETLERGLDIMEETLAEVTAGQ